MSLELSLLIIVVFVFIGILSGAPIGYVFGFSSIIFLLMSGNLKGLTWIVPASIKFMQGYAFLAVPLYIMVGSMMLQTQLSADLFNLLRSLLRGSKGAFGTALIAFVSVFGAITGSAAAAVSAIGPLAIPEGSKSGYNTEHIAGLVACASLIAMLIPPSVTMIVFGISGGLSIPLLFLATAIPGVLTAVFFMGINLAFISKLSPSGEPDSTPRELSTLYQAKKARLYHAKKAWPSLVLPFIILGGIYGGILTPTEAAAVALVWIIIYHLGTSAKSASKFRFGLNTLGRGFVDASTIIGALCPLVFLMFTLSRVMIFVNVPILIQDFFVATIPNKFIFLILVNIIMIAMGMIMDDVSGCILAAIFLLPSAVQFGVDPYHFGAIVGVNLGLGNLTPPVAPILYLAAVIGNVKVKLFPPNTYIKTVAYLLLFGQLPVLILVTYIPEISLFLPNLWGGH